MLAISIGRVPTGVPSAVIRDGLAIIRQKLEKAGYQGTWTAVPLTNCRVKSQIEFKVCRHNNGKLYVKTKPGDNGTCWEWELRPPSPYNAEITFRDLLDREVEEERTEAAPKAKKAALTLGGKPVPVAVPEPAPAPPPAPEKYQTSVEAAAGGMQGLGAKIVALEAAASAMAARRQAIADLTKAAEEMLAEIDRLEAEDKVDAVGAQAISTLQSLRSLMGAL